LEFLVEEKSMKGWTYVFFGVIMAHGGEIMVAFYEFGKARKEN